jgi:hypothetical protein
VSGKSLEALWPQVRQWAHDGSIDSVWLVQVWDLGGQRLLPHHEVPPGFTDRELAALRVSSGTGLRLLALDRADAPLGTDCRPGVAPADNGGP